MFILNIKRFITICSGIHGNPRPTWSFCHGILWDHGSGQAFNCGIQWDHGSNSVRDSGIQPNHRSAIGIHAHVCFRPFQTSPIKALYILNAIYKYQQIQIQPQSDAKRPGTMRTWSGPARCDLQVNINSTPSRPVAAEPIQFTSRGRRPSPVILPVNKGEERDYVLSIRWKWWH